jgi:hypothetical protein
MICFIEVRFLQTYSPLRWSQRPGLFQPFPSLKRSFRPSELLFSIKRNTKFPQGPPHNWCLLPWLQLSLITRRMRKKRSNTSARAQMNTNVTLSSHFWFGVIPDLGEDLISLVVSRIECYSSSKVLKVENLDAIECGVVGVFIAPTTKMWSLGDCCRMAHRTVRCATRHCLVRQPRQPAVGFWPLELWLVGPLGCPVVHQTCPVDCPMRQLRVLCPLRAQARIKCVAVDRCARSSRCSAAHRTVRCDTGHCPVLHRTVRWIIAERPPIFPKVASSASSALVHQTLSGALDQGAFWDVFCSLCLNPFLAFYWLIVNLWHL